MIKPSDAPPHLWWMSPDDAAGMVAHFGWVLVPVGRNPDTGRYNKPLRAWGSAFYEMPGDVFRSWPPGGAGAAVVCGPSGLVVVDRDRPIPIDWPLPVPTTYERLSINRGLIHEYWLQPESIPPIGSTR